MIITPYTPDSRHFMDFIDDILDNQTEVVEATQAEHNTDTLSLMNRNFMDFEKNNIYSHLLMHKLLLVSWILLMMLQKLFLLKIWK